MNLYLVFDQHLKRGEIDKQPRWKINNAPHSFNLWQLRTFCLTQLNNRIDSEGDSLEDKILNLSQVNQITKENLPYVVIDSPAWVAGDEFLVFRLFQNHQHHTHFRMPRPLIEIHSHQVEFQNTTLLDWVSFTYQMEKPYHYHFAEDWVEKFNSILISLFGFGITAHKNKGWFGYTDSFTLGKSWGIVAAGGSSQQNTVYVSLTGQGCSMAKLGWEQRLFEFLTDPEIQSPRLTRVDIAFDDYEGNYFTPEQARAECNKKKHGIFFTQGRPPSWEMIGDWDSPTGKKTLYVGSASCEKRLRVYTKGRALGDPDSPWIRSEWVLRHSSQFVLPFDLLTRSSQYLAAAYRTPKKSGPFQFLMNSDDELASSRLKLASHTVPISVDKQIRHARRAAGKLIHTLKQLGYSDSQIIEQLESQGTPPKLIPALELLQRFTQSTDIPN